MGGACTKSTVVQVGESTVENDMLTKQLEESKAREELHFKVRTAPSPIATPFPSNPIHFTLIHPPLLCILL